MDKYICIVKTPEKHLRYHVNDLIKFTAYLDSKYDWKYFNVYNEKTRAQIGNFTINNKPTSRRISM